MLQKLEEIGVKLENPEIKIVSMIGTAKISNLLNLELISIYLENYLYDPTIFPAIIYHMKDPKASFLLFSTGKIICVGVNNKETLLVATSKLKKQPNNLEAKIMNSNAVKHEDTLYI